MRKLFFTSICLLSFIIVSAQSKKINAEDIKIKKTIINFLKWYKQTSDAGNEDTIIDSTQLHKVILVEEHVDSLTKLSVDMIAVEGYLKHIRSSNCVSESFINDLRQYHQKIADEIKKYPLYPKSEDHFPIPGLNLDVIFGFEPEEILDHFKQGNFTKIYTIYDKAIVKFDISKLKQYIFTMTKTNGTWLIDYYGLDRTNLDRLNK
jgi:hypothetical protein